MLRRAAAWVIVLTRTVITGSERQHFLLDFLVEM